jgi:RNA-directed DNA polymerase
MTWKGNKSRNLSSFSFIRYADDFVCIHESKEVILKAKEIITNYLSPIGLELKEKKTKITHTSDGFNFLGFNIRQYPVGKNHSGKCGGKLLGFKTLIKPNKEAVKEHYNKIATVIQENKSSSQTALISKLNPIIKGWSNYNKTVVSKETFNYLDNLVYRKLWRWSKRRHPNKGKKWVKNRYWKTVELRNRVFGNEDYKLSSYSETPITRHVKVRAVISEQLSVISEHLLVFNSQFYPLIIYCQLVTDN